MVFIIDDEADYRFLLQQVFSRFLPQYPVRFFAGGDVLRQHVLAQGERPRVVLLDLHMPVLNGRQTLHFLKRESNWEQVPVVMMTNALSDDDLNACYQTGASSFLLKPSGLEQMQQEMGLICQYWLTMNQLPNGKPAVTN